MTKIFGTFVGLLLGFASVFLLVWLLWWLWTRRDQEKETPLIEIKTEPPPTAVEPPIAADKVVAKAETAKEPPVPDDLKRVEGIGPKISGVLQEAGITTFAQLADLDVGEIEKILEKADPRLLRLANPSTWPEQAALAAAGEGEALEALQKELKAGRRT
jgi:predicted flap endonuclease-1-like 5' DNA nuclease